MARKGPILLALLALVLVGTVAVLSTFTYYFDVDSAAFITELEVPPSAGRANSTEARAKEKIQRILHQTWKTDVLPERWQSISDQCREMMPDYEYMLWTDELSRDFIAREYSWFLSTFDSYKYPIQRADAIRYFVLHYYGGIYLDLDVGCLRSLDPLLEYSVILPKTIPIGVSNDLMFAEKGHPFMDQTIHNLVNFDHDWVINYPTVMFSTGPMFLSAQYGIYAASHLHDPAHPSSEVRILPKPLYGKNAKEGEAPHSFFQHYYGSSWHSDDAAFVTFLGKWGKTVMAVGLVGLVGGVVVMYWSKKKGRGIRRRFGRYDLLLPRTYVDSNGHQRLDLGLFTLSTSLSASNTRPSSPTSANFSPSTSRPQTPSTPGLPLSLPFDLPQRTPRASTDSSSTESTASGSTMAQAVHSARSWTGSVLGRFSRLRDHRKTRSIAPSSGSRGVLFFMPAIFTPGSSSERSLRRGEAYLPLVRVGPPPSRPRSEKRHELSDLESSVVVPQATDSLYAAGSSGVYRNPSANNSDVALGSAPPPYHHSGEGSSASASASRVRTQAGESWVDWQSNPTQ